MKALKNTDIYLGYLGLIPFIFFTICLSLSYKHTFIFGNTLQALTSYSLIIASFIAGSHWGRQVNIETLTNRVLLQIGSNINVIAIWIAYLCLSPKTIIAVMIIEFVVLLKFDFFIYKQKLISYKYLFCIRVPITIFVVSLLAISWSMI